jgi:hypothetical protein
MHSEHRILNVIYIFVFAHQQQFKTLDLSQSAQDIHRYTQLVSARLENKQQQNKTT